MSTNDLAFMASAAQSQDQHLEFLFFGQGGKVFAKKTSSGWALPAIKKSPEWDLATSAVPGLIALLGLTPTKSIPFFGQTKGTNYRLTFLVQNVDKDLMGAHLTTTFNEKVQVIDVHELLGNSDAGLAEYYRAMIRNIYTNVFGSVF